MRMQHTAKNNRLAGTTLLLILLNWSSFALAKDPIYTNFFSDKALGGYDAVSYFRNEEPQKGSKKFSFEWKGATWLFSTAEHLGLFKNNPEAYAPQYGGYCAWAVAENNDFAPGDPEYWKIVKGKLYLNYNKKIQTRWEQNIPAFIQTANENWPELIGGANK